MKKCIRYISILFFISILVLATNINASPYNLLVNHELIEAELLKENDRILVPMRPIFEAMNATVDWNQEEGKVVATKGEMKIVLIPSVNYVEVNGEEKILDVPPKIVSGKTMVPVRFIAETLGADVKWFNRTGTVSILDKDNKIKYKYPYDLSNKEIQDALNLGKIGFLNSNQKFRSTYDLEPSDTILGSYYKYGIVWNSRSHVWMSSMLGRLNTLQEVLDDEYFNDYIDKEVIIIALDFYANSESLKDDQNPTMDIIQYDEEGTEMIIAPVMEDISISIKKSEYWPSEPAYVVTYSSTYSNSPEYNLYDYINYKAPATLYFALNEHDFVEFHLDFSKY